MVPCCTSGLKVASLQRLPKTSQTPAAQHEDALTEFASESVVEMIFVQSAGPWIKPIPLQSAFSLVFMVARVVWSGNKVSSFCLCQLHELQDRNMECLGMLHESQEEIKELRNKAGPSAHLCFSQAYGVFAGVRDNANHHVPKKRKERKFRFYFPECDLSDS